MVEAASFVERNSDSIVLSVLSVIVGAAVTWFVARRYGLPKTVDVVVRENTLILTDAAGTAGEKLRVTWDGTELSVPRLLRLRVINSGRQTVRDRDFDPGEALWLHVLGGASVKAPDVTASSPGVVCDVRLDSARPHRVGFLPTSLQPGEWVDLQLVLDGVYTGLSTQARSDLTRQPRLVTGEQPREVLDRAATRWLSTSLVSMVAAAGAAALADQAAHPFVHNLLDALALILALVSLSCVLFFASLAVLASLNATRHRRYLREQPPGQERTHSWFTWRRLRD